MRKILGIWQSDLSLIKLRELRAGGFNAIFLPVQYFWERTAGDYESRQIDVSKMMYSYYTLLKKMGYTFFLIDFGWGLGEIDNNYFFKKIFEAFKSSEDVWFYFGEPIESFVESGRFEYYTVKKIIDERFSIAGERLLIDGTTRNIEKLRKDFPHIKNAISSYYNQHKYWTKGQKMCWIYGQLKIGGSLCYKKLAKEADENKIKIRFLYQADDGKFELKIPFTWLNSLLRLIKLDIQFKRWQQKRFINHFG